MDETARPGLRERKKNKTRALIIEVADRLFRRHGFDAVTLERVADECEVSVRTILRYFNTKEALAMAPEADSLERFKAELRETHLDAVAFWRSWVANGVEALTANEAPMRKRLKGVMAHPALFAELLGLSHKYEDVLTAAIDEEHGGKDPLGSRLLATMLISGNAATIRQWVRSDEPFDPKVLLKVVDYAADAFHPTNFTKTWSPKLGARKNGR